ncbi:MAG TPA: cytochrome c3 family protein [Geobacteraceae bacterium]
MKRFLLSAMLCVLSAPFILYAKDYKIVTFNTPNAGKVLFPHEPHLKKLGYNCTSCHNTLYTIGKKNTSVTMAEMEKGKSCGFCHNKTRAFPLSDCVKCHVVGEVSIKIPDFGAVTFSHPFHLTMYGCSDCHTKLFKPGPGNPHVSMADMAKGVSCGACHDGKTGFTVKENCTRCHTVKDISFSADALFSHKFHLEMYKCGDCHSRLFIAGPNSKRSLMLDMESGRSCGGCHNGKDAFSVKGDCLKCHKGDKEIPYKSTDALFSHKFHTAPAMYICSDCHSGIFVGGPGSRRSTMADMAQNRSCGACHDGFIGFSAGGSCDRCHKSTKEITFTVPDLNPVQFSHSIHVGMFKCDDCHNKLFTTGVQRKSYTMAQMEKGHSCGACHEGKTAFPVATACGKCHPVKDLTMAIDAFFSHNRHLEMFKCYDCHDKLFVANSENQRYTMAQMEKGRSCGACHDATIAFSVKGDCNRCHKSTVEITFQVKQTGPTVFSHKIHTGMYKCDDCHNGIFGTGKSAKRFTMAQMEGGESCGTCHDGKTAFSVKENCQRCHPTKEVQFRESGAVFSHKFHTGLYRCNDCHDQGFIPGPGNRRYAMAEMEKGKSCGMCHDGSTAFAVTASCEKCHPVTRAIKYEFPRKNVGSVLFSHKVHLGRGYGCGDCHYKIIPTGTNRKSSTMRDMESGKSCGACHGFAMAFTVKDPNNCERCHQRDEGPSE